MTQFADIRPYNDDEVPAVLERLLTDEELLAAIARLKLGKWQRPLAWLAYPLIRGYLRRQLRGVRDVKQFQMVVKHYMDDMVARTTHGFSVSGLEHLSADGPYLFISNHRDIALDPAFVNYALYHNQHDTVRIAIGDNLLTKPFVSDLMRLNKSFIVKRSAKGPRQVMAAYKDLSRYIRHSIEVDRCPIWIAQREGRAKDGNDRTEKAIIKMLAMSQDKGNETFSAFINKLRIVPVSISYELDPLDGAKARELHQVATQGKYEKAEHEDVGSIAQGISGDKGAVHVAFGTPLTGEFADAGVVAQAIDEQVIALYRLHPTNYFAYKLLHGHYPELPGEAPFDPEADPALAQKERVFSGRIETLPEEYRETALGIYANIIHRKLALSH